MMPTDAVEADVLQVVLAGQLLALVELLGGPELVPLGMAERGVVVEADLGVEGVHAAVGPQDQRVDLGQVAVALGEAAVQLDEDVGHAVDGVGVDVGVDARLARGRRATSPSTGSMCSITIASGFGLGDRLDLDAALGATASAGASWRRGRA